MKVYIDRIPEDGLSLESEESPKIIDIEDTQENFKENISVRIRAFKISDNLIVTGTLSTHVTLVCSKCLKKFPYLIENKKFAYDCEILNQDIIDLTDSIREDIIVALPVRPLCYEGCKGLCSRCGQNLENGNCGCQKELTQDGPFDVLDDLL